MSWFQRLCRQSGLMVHHVTQGAKQPVAKRKAHEVKRDTEEQSPEPGVTLRRTTIEEIELRGDTRLGDSEK